MARRRTSKRFKANTILRLQASAKMVIVLLVEALEIDLVKIHPRPQVAGSWNGALRSPFGLLTALSITADVTDKASLPA